MQSINEDECPFPETVRDSKSIITVVDHHEYVSKLLTQNHCLKDIVLLVSITPDSYVHDVKEWINNRKAAHHVNDPIVY